MPAEERVVARGTRARCIVCGGWIVAIKDPRVISLTAGIWVHESAVRRLLAQHGARP